MAKWIKKQANQVGLDVKEENIIKGNRGVKSGKERSFWAITCESDCEPSANGWKKKTSAHHRKNKRSQGGNSPMPQTSVI